MTKPLSGSTTFQIEIRVARTFKTVTKTAFVALEYLGLKMAMEFLNRKK